MQMIWPLKRASFNCKVSRVTSSIADHWINCSFLINQQSDRNDQLPAKTTYSIGLCVPAQYSSFSSSSPSYQARLVPIMPVIKRAPSETTMQRLITESRVDVYYLLPISTLPFIVTECNLPRQANRGMMKNITAFCSNVSDILQIVFSLLFRLDKNKI